MQVSTLLTVQGEKVVVSVLDRHSPLARISKLDLLPYTRQRFETLLEKRSGLLLVTGPADSGDRSLITVEGWVRRWIDGLTQVQTNPPLGLTFAAALQSFVQLAADPSLDDRDSSGGRAA